MSNVPNYKSFVVGDRIVWPHHGYWELNPNGKWYGFFEDGKLNYGQNQVNSQIFIDAQYNYDIEYVPVNKINRNFRHLLNIWKH
jgi:hypothetical protein